jgi:DNA-directed RNA polymerase subunit beta'
MTLYNPPQPSKKKAFEFINKVVDKGELRRLLSKVYADHGTAKTGTLANMLKDLGFKYATRAGVTISIEDLVVPDAKKALLGDAENQIEAATQRFLKGEITEVERYTKVIDTWSETTEKLTKLVVDNFDRMNPVYMMAFSGARGNISQVRQLVGMRGLMADAQGQIIDLPIKSNFREGLSVTEYIISSYGARKGLVDTALKTADSGYLTRRLVDVAQDVIIQEPDCGTEAGVLMQAIVEGDNVMVSLEDRLLSRSAAVNVVDADGEVLVLAGDIFTPVSAKMVAKAGVKQVLVRSGLTCQSAFGICQKCYGWSLTTNKPVDIGEAIGIMAAQSIGEPGTQLTMRTFHTGGVFSGSSNRELVNVKRDGTLLTDLPIRDFRTRHGEEVKITTREVLVEVKTAKGIDQYNLPSNATVYFHKSGDALPAGALFAEFEPGGARGDARRLTEKATKDINAAMSGEIFFENFDADEKRDRQGNITRTANRPGTIWVLNGDVYNLPAGSKHKVEDGQPIVEGQIIAETLVVSEHGGQLRLPEDLETDVVDVGGETIHKIVNGKELTIIIASIQPSNASLKPTKKEHLWVVDGPLPDGVESEQYILKSPEGTVVENGSIIAELIDDSLMAPTSGEIRYESVEVDDQRIVTTPGKVYFIPEEIHPISKDISLKMPGMETGMMVKAGTEVVKDVVTRTDGILEIVEENDIIHEVIVRPGERFKVDDVSTLSVDDGTVVEAGTRVAEGIVAKERSMVTIQFQISEPDDMMDDEEPDDTGEYEYAEVLLRPVQEFEVSPRSVNIKFSSTEDENISVVPVTQLLYKDGDKVRNIEGAPLIRTSLVLQMKGYLTRMKGLVELVKPELGQPTVDKVLDEQNFKLVVLENLIIRREATADSARLQTATQTQLLVSDGQIIDKRTPVVKIQVLARTSGKVSLGNALEGKDVRRVLLINTNHQSVVPVKGKPTVASGAYVKLDQIISDEGSLATTSGYVEAVSDRSITLRKGRPYLISGGAQLQVEHRALTQRGDLIATLIFERQKTGDIVQGLPRVEELLEGRKPKDSCIIAAYEGVAEIQNDEDGVRLYLNHTHGREEISIPLGANILVEDKEVIVAGQSLTDGPINPHDVLAINGTTAVRKYLVDEVQRVYRSQGVEIADKHIEIIVRQMTKKVRVDDGGETTLLSGELVDDKVVTEANRVATQQGFEQMAVAHPVLLGITKASLNTESFISAASFQETTRVLTEAAVEGKQDYLRGLKENVIIGRLIPAGTGFPHFKDERGDMMEDPSLAGHSNARKPSAILEEIESMFGAPDIMAGQLLADDSLSLMDPDMMGVIDEEEDAFRGAGSIVGASDELIDDEG